jgi:hypothetical protein
MDDSGSVIGLSAGGGVVTIILYLLVKMCYRKELHTKIKSACCETRLDIGENTSPIQEKT